MYALKRTNEDQQMTITVIEYCFYSLWIYWGLKYGLPFFSKYFIDTGSDRYGSKK